MERQEPRTIVLTGASDGIGAAAARQLAQRGQRIVLIGRSAQKTGALARELGAEHHIADFERLDEVRGLADALLGQCERIDVLANNAGGLFQGPQRTIDGFERTFQVNHLAHFLLTHLLRERLLVSRAAVVNTASVAARTLSRFDLEDIETARRFTASRAYGNAKLANIMFTKGLHEHFGHRGLSAVAFHPGVVATNFAAGMNGLAHRIYHGAMRRLLVSPEQGGARLRAFIEGEPGVDWQSGEYYDRPGRRGKTARAASNPAAVRRHWVLSANMLGIETERESDEQNASGS